jgi:uncharacterized membrane-anchored protein YitT (DUF2179 family)
MKTSTEKRFKITKETLKQEVQDYFFILLGLSLYAFAWTGFLIPAQITSGGATGMSALVTYATGCSIGLPYSIIQFVLMSMSVYFFGLKFSFRTIVNVAVLALLLTWFQALFKEPFVHGEPFMNAIIGGIISGVGVGLVFNFKGSTGGTDIVAMIINKYKPQITLGKGLLVCDAIIISSSYLIFHSVEKIVYGLVVMGVFSYTVDLVMNGTRQSVQFFIFSDKYDEIATAINQVAHRGCTLLDGTGWYSKHPVKVVVVMAKKNESVSIFRIVQSIDPKAFVSQTAVRGVYGNGFDPMRT